MSRKFNKILIKIVVSTALLGFLLWRVDRQSVIENFRLLDPTYIPLIFFMFILNYVVSSIRWKMLLIYENSKEAGLSYLTSLYFIGSFFNNFMPTSIGGDVYKIAKLGRKIKDNANALSATFMERFTGMIALVIISYVGLVQTFDFWVSLLPASLSSSGALVFVFKAVLILGFWIAAVMGFLFLKFFSIRIPAIERVYVSIIKYVSEKRVIFYAFLTSFIVQFIAIFTHYLVFKAIGVDLPVTYSLFVFPVVFLASFVIPSLNGIGVQDALYIEFFSVVGVTDSVSLSASLIYHLFRMFVSLIGGVLYAFGKAD